MINIQEGTHCYNNNDINFVLTYYKRAQIFVIHFHGMVLEDEDVFFCKTKWDLHNINNENINILTLNDKNLENNRRLLTYAFHDTTKTQYEIEYKNILKQLINMLSPKYIIFTGVSIGTTPSIYYGTQFKSTILCFNPYIYFSTDDKKINVKHININKAILENKDTFDKIIIYLNKNDLTFFQYGKTLIKFLSDNVPNKLKYVLHDNMTIKNNGHSSFLPNGITFENVILSAIDPYKIYYINLDRSTQRKKSVEDQLNLKLTLSTKNQWPIQHQRIVAFDASDGWNKENNSYFDEQLNETYYFHKKKDLEHKITDRNVAITLSHFKAIKKFLKDDIDFGIIIEDDVSFQYIDNFRELLDDVIKYAPENWDVISLHSSLNRVIEKNIEHYKNGINFYKLEKNEMKSSACYIINKKGATELLKRYLVNGIYTFPYQYELCSSESIIHQLNSYIYTKPTIAIIDNNISSVGSAHPFDKKSNEVIKKFYLE